ncbi:hypothetical protein HDU82_000580 [Entophlyctis luteolus]|nr:hypothetical protein HDU82_000580 [Entophlyctis luteolus]
MPHLTQTSSLGTHALISRLKLLIRNHATQHSPNPTPASPTTLDTMISAQPEEFWTDLAARICFAAPTNSRAQMTVTAQNNSLGPYAVYESKATDVHVRFARDSKNNADENQDSHDAIVLRIPGWVRERAAEVWFEGSGAIPGDDDSLVSVILSTLIKVPIDSRAAVARNIVFVGGGAMFCGIPERCEADLRSFGGDNGEFVISGGRGGAGKRGGGGGGGRMYRFDEVRRLVREKIAVARPVFPANILAWVGGSLAGSLKMTQKELRRDEYVALREAERAQCVPDWGRLAPPEDADTNEAAAEDSEK